MDDFPEEKTFRTFQGAIIGVDKNNPDEIKFSSLTTQRVPDIRNLPKGLIYYSLSDIIETNFQYTRAYYESWHDPNFGKINKEHDHA